ncbi:MAG: HIT family protein [Rhabdochlamydiaceae bacterium]|nr:HIT family protein [Rhabdochlamydiaceae bacterium]
MNYLKNDLFASENSPLFTAIPDKQILDKSLQISVPGQKFRDWSKQNHADSYVVMQRIAQAWKKSNITDQYLIYGKADSHSFHWDMIPYQKCHTSIGRIVQQLQVLWRSTFGGIEVSENSLKNQLKEYQLLLSPSSEIIQSTENANKGNDSFCKDTTIERQWVVMGKRVHVLFNYAPIGFGGERLHFLVVPKNHREAFTDVTKEEYCESLAITSKIVDHFIKTRKNIKDVYFLNKTGVDAGQTVKHWHLHVIFSSNSAQNFWGRITFLKNILLGSAPMKKDSLAKRVGELRKELATLK